MCLATLFWQAKLPFAVAHVNYGLRGQDSDADEALVKQWAKERNIPCFIEMADVAGYQQTHKLGLQEAARDIRYQFFRRLAAETPFKQLVTAHQRNDQDETMLLHFFRGTGLRGLRGIPTGEINGVRPLLDIERNEIMDWLAQHEVPYRVDESNATSKYTRNALRNEVIPF